MAQTAHCVRIIFARGQPYDAKMPQKPDEPRLNASALLPLAAALSQRPALRKQLPELLVRSPHTAQTEKTPSQRAQHATRQGPLPHDGRLPGQDLRWGQSSFIVGAPTAKRCLRNVQCAHVVEYAEICRKDSWS